MDHINETHGSLQDGNEEPLTSAAECLSRLLHTEELADLTLILPSTKQPLKVHRLVLAMWSPVFKAMLFGSMSEGDSINLPEDPPEAFNWMLDYMYGGGSRLPNIEVAIHVYMLANKYQMDHLKTICSKFLMATVTAVSVPEVMKVATLLEDDGLTMKCTEILDTSPDDVFLSSSVGSFSSETLQQLLSLEMPISSETVIFKGLLTWGRTQLILRDEEETSANLRQEIDKFLPQIRFMTMTQDEFAKNVLPEYILTLEEVTPILQVLAGVQEVNIPKACSDIRTPRIRFNISRLKCCYISYDNFNTGEESYDVVEDRELLKVKPKKQIYLNKFEFDVNILDYGELTVTDSAGQDIDTVEFLGQVAEFKKPLKLLPDQEYSFVLKGSDNRYLIKHNYHIENNEIFSGKFVFTSENIMVYYWK